MNCSFMPCYQQKYCRFPKQQWHGGRKRACEAPATYVLMVDNFRTGVEYYCSEHIDKRIAEIRWQMDSERKRKALSA